MARRADAARIAAAKREGTRQRLILAGILRERVDELFAAHEALPESQGQALDGEAAYRWVLDRRRLRSEPKRSFPS